MKCPNCGYENRIGAKFCSECAYKLYDIPDGILNVPLVLDEKLSNELMELWKLYETDQFDIALKKIDDIKKNLSGSSSVYSLAALIYEKRAKYEYDNDDMAAYYDDLGNAAKAYEEVVKQNPNSAADRAKLLAIRHKLMASADVILDNKPPAFVSMLKKLPLPVWAAVVVFVLIVTGALVARGLSGREEGITKVVTPARVNVPPSTVAPMPQYTDQMNQFQPQTQQQSGGVYTFPLARQNQPSQAPQSAQESRIYADRQQPYDAGSERTLAPVEPMKLPSLVKVVPSNGNRNGTSGSKSGSTQIQVAPNNSGQNSPELSIQTHQNQNDDNGDDADTWLARAIEFEKQGHDSYARAAAERAQKLFQRNLADGRNPEVSENGIELTKGILRKLDNKKQ